MSAVNGGWDGPPIVKDGLVLYLDAGSPNSFYSPTAGTTWKDISGNTNNGTLINGPTFNTGSGGSIVFDGTDDYVTLLNSINITNIFTISVWCSFAELGSIGSGFTKRKTLISYNYPYSSNNGFAFIGSGNNGTDFFISIGTDQKFATSTTGYISLNTPVMLTVVANAGNELIRLYKNNTEVNYAGRTDANINIIYNNTPNIGILSPAGQNYMNGSIYNTVIYNRALTSSEINQNFQATRARFGI
jgi:hypothetical protein